MLATQRGEHQHQNRRISFVLLRTLWWFGFGRALVMKISGRDVGDGHPVFVVAEIGQNHQGSLEVAKRMIVKAKVVNCVVLFNC